MTVFARSLVITMGVDAYQTNQTTRTTFRALRTGSASQGAAPSVGCHPSAECRPSAIKCRPLDHVPPLDWVPPRVKCRPLSNSRTRFCLASPPLVSGKFLIGLWVVRS